MTYLHVDLVLPVPPSSSTMVATRLLTAQAGAQQVVPPGNYLTLAVISSNTLAVSSSNRSMMESILKELTL